MPNAGDKLRAADVTFLPGSQELPNDETPAAENTWEDWGDPIIIDNPGIPCVVLGWGSGSAVNDGSDSGVAMRLRISTDGGANWEAGTGPRDQTGSGGATRRGSLVCQHVVTTASAPSGQIHVQAQRLATVIDGSNPNFWEGSIAALVIPHA